MSLNVVTPSRRPPGPLLRVAAGALAVFVVVGVGHALAAPHHPFAVGGSEGGGACGMFSWLLGPEIFFKRQVELAVHAAAKNIAAVWLLVAISAIYGVLHAAGPGHGKAVVAAYMVANEQALRRGLVISFLAAMLQGLVAVAFVTIAAFVLGIPISRTNSASELIESAGYVGVALLGAWLTWRKGRSFVRALRSAAPGAPDAARTARASVGAAAVNDRLSAPVALPHGHDDHAHGHDHAILHDEHVHDATCGHFHAPDPSRLGEGFSWGAAALTVLAAGARPCGGAILVLLFTLRQGIFGIGIASVIAMSLGTAITTGALASAAVLSKTFALRFMGRETRRGIVAATGIELAAAVVVLLVGVALLLGSWGVMACG